MRSVEMKNIIIGTAGHIDHGKTALVRALTGIDTDRLKEEKQRGISIDLGFAHLQLSENLRLGFVDVPGHERFIKNMLAGVGGIDLVLFVIAADESIKPQTREHFDICMLLGIRKGIVVLTKADLADARSAGAGAAGSRRIRARIVPGRRSDGGRQLDDRRRDWTSCAPKSRRWPRPFAEKDASQYFRLPIDRAFTMRGFGARGHRHAGFGRRARGTGSGAASGSASASACAASRCMARACEQATAGQRTALNIAGVDVFGTAARHGAGRSRTFPRHHANRLRVRAAALGQAAEASRARCIFTPAPRKWKPKCAGSRAPSRSRPASREYVRLLLSEPLLLAARRSLHRAYVLAGGDHRRRSGAGYRARRAARTLDRLRILETAPHAERIALLVSESRYGMGMPELVARTGWLEADIRKAAGDRRSLIVLDSPQFWLLDREVGRRASWKRCTNI